MDPNKTIEEDSVKLDWFEILLLRPTRNIIKDWKFTLLIIFMFGGMAYAGYDRGFHNGQVYQCNVLGGERMTNWVDGQTKCVSRNTVLEMLKQQNKGMLLLHPPELLEEIKERQQLYNESRLKDDII